MGSSSYEAFSKDEEISNNVVETKKYSKNTEALMNLEAKRIDAVVVDEVVGRYYISKKPGLYIIYFGLGTIGIKFTPFMAANLAFILNYAAYYTEIFRGGITSIDKGQYEGAYVIGLNRRQTMINIIFPQAFKRVIPSITNESINLIKDTALVSVIGMGDMLRNAKEIVTRSLT